MIQRVKGLIRVCLVMALACLYLTQASAPLALASPHANTVCVAPNGNNGADCGSTASPCRTIQYAVNKAGPGDEILVAAGTYAFDAPNDICSSNVAQTAVVCYINKVLTIKGGYSPSNWSVPDPSTNQTIIDGQDTYRGVYVISTGPAASLYMDGFTIQRGLAQGPSNQAGYGSYGFGGGMLVDSSPVTLKNIVFRHNRAIGGNNEQTQYGGAGSGGGLALRASPDANLENIVFEYNQALGGTGPTRGGYGIGGGWFAYRSVVWGQHITMANNVARAGDSNGHGICSAGERADAHGGGAAFHESDPVTLQYVTVKGNQAIGGNAREQAGGGFGGGIMAQAGARAASITLRDAELRDNLALGGNAVNGWLGHGGAMETLNASVSLDRVLVIHNTAQGGSGTTGAKGSGGGGGLNFYRLVNNGSTVSIANSVIANNIVEMPGSGAEVGGGGGGVWLYGVDAEVVHTTIARNYLGSSYTQGEAVILLNGGGPTAAKAHFSYCIIEGHSSQSNVAALHVQSGGNTAILDRTLWAANNKDSNAGESASGTIHDNNPIHALSAGFSSPGSPHYDYHIRDSSPARDQAVGSSIELDFDREQRVSCGTLDIGADEYLPPALALANPRPGERSLALDWEASSNVLASLHHFNLIVSCPPGASPPNQGPCGTPINVGQQMALTLTGLTNGKTYTITVEARDASNALLAASNTVNGTPIHFSFMVVVPIVTK